MAPWGALLALAPDVDLVHDHLASIPSICTGGRDAGPIGALSPVERFDWLVASRSPPAASKTVLPSQAGDPGMTCSLRQWYKHSDPGCMRACGREDRESDKIQITFFVTDDRWSE